MKKRFSLLQNLGGIGTLAPMILMAVFFLYVVISSFSLQAFSNDFLGPGFMPKVIGIIGLACLAGICVSKRIEGKKEKQEDDEAGDGKEKAKENTTFNIVSFIRLHTGLSTLILIAMYIAAMDALGFVLSSCAYLFLQIALLSPKLDRKAIIFNVILSVGFSVIVYILFVKFFLVVLPAGILG
jgi:hypothetical protein